MWVLVHAAEGELRLVLVLLSWFMQGELWFVHIERESFYMRLAVYLHVSSRLLAYHWMFACTSQRSVHM
jgi:hypothetical protein